MPLEQLFSVPMISRPLGSEAVFSASLPASGPLTAMGVMAEMRRL